MKLQQVKHWSRPALAAATGLVLVVATGCQTTVGGQVLPSAYYLSDDVQYYPAGPEDKLYRERAALAQYKAGQLQPPVAPAAPAPGAAPPAPQPPPQ